MIAGSQVLLSIIILFVLWRSYVAYKRKNLSDSFFVVWAIFWSGVLVLIFQQDLVSQVAYMLGISRGVDLVIYISLIIIFFIFYRVLVLLNEVDQKVTKIVRKLAIDKQRLHKR